MQAQRRYASPAEPALPSDLPAPAARSSAGTLPLSAAAASGVRAQQGGAGGAARGARAAGATVPAAASLGAAPARALGAGAGGPAQLPLPQEAPPGAASRGKPLMSSPITAPTRTRSEPPSPAGGAGVGWVPPASVYSAPSRRPVARVLDAGSCSPVRLRGSGSDDSDTMAAEPPALRGGSGGASREWSAVVPSVAATVGTPPARRAPAPRPRRVSAPAHDALVWRAADESDDDDDDEGGAGGGDPEAAEAARRTETLRALRAAAITRRVARQSEHRPASAGGSGGFAEQAAAQPTALIPPIELAARIARLDVSLQRYLAGVLCGLEAASAAAAVAAPPPAFAFAPPPLAPPARRASPAPDFFSDEGGPCGAAPSAADAVGAGGYASPGGRDTSASDDVDDAGGAATLPPARQPRRSTQRSRSPRFSAAGVAGEGRLPRRAPAPVVPPSPLAYAFASPDEGQEGAEAAARKLQESPRPMGPSAPRLAARRVSHGHPGGALPSDLAAAALRAR